MKDFDRKLRLFTTVLQQGPFSLIIVQDSFENYVDLVSGDAWAR